MDQSDNRCKERLRNFSCCLALSFNHEIHMAVDYEGRVLARWRMEAVALDDPQ